jgi:transcriptional regulator with XRE-family HTH domain
MANELSVVIGQRIREERAARGLQQKELAEAIGIDEGALCRIEKGQRNIDSLTLRLVAQEFSMPMEALFEPAEVAEALVLARQGDAASPAMEDMIRWGEQLERNLAFVESELARP